MRMTLKSRIDLIVFDIYNTLFKNDAQSWIRTFQVICNDQRLSILPKDLWKTWRDIGTQRRLTRVTLEKPKQTSQFETYQDHWIKVFHETFDQLEIHANAERASLICVQALSDREPYEDMLSTMSHIQVNWKTAAITNADNASLFPLLKKHSLNFEHVLTSEILGAYKPDPLVFKSIIDISGIPAKRILFVGDTQLDDIHGAKTADMSAVWINRHGESMDRSLIPPDSQINSLTQLLNTLDR